MCVRYACLSVSGCACAAGYIAQHFMSVTRSVHPIVQTFVVRSSTSCDGQATWRSRGGVVNGLKMSITAREKFCKFNVSEGSIHGKAMWQACYRHNAPTERYARPQSIMFTVAAAEDCGGRDTCKTLAFSWRGNRTFACHWH